MLYFLTFFISFVLWIALFVGIHLEKEKILEESEYSELYADANEDPGIKKTPQEDERAEVPVDTSEALGTEKKSVDKSEDRSAEKILQEKLKPMILWMPWPLDLSALRDHDALSNPLGADFDYAAAFNALDLEAVKKDINTQLTSTQYIRWSNSKNHSPFFIQMTWYDAVTYRTSDGRGGSDGGQQRFDDQSNRPDFITFETDRRLSLWPVKQRYGAALSWSDLMALAGTVALENLGLKTYGFAGGRTDDWETDTIYWGPGSKPFFSEQNDKNSESSPPLALMNTGRIDLSIGQRNPLQKTDPLDSAKHIRKAFTRMGMNDEETVALAVGSYSFANTRGAFEFHGCLAAEPSASSSEYWQFEWKSNCDRCFPEGTTIDGMKQEWRQTPIQWASIYLNDLLNKEWESEKSMHGIIRWHLKDSELYGALPNAHTRDKYYTPTMTTDDLALKYDPAYKKIAEHFLANPDIFEDVFARAWYKLTHQDMGPKTRYLGSDVPEGTMLWQDPVTAPDYDSISDADIAALKRHIIAADISIADRVRLAWGSASTFRASDMRGGANGARIALQPQAGWAVNNPEKTANTIDALKAVQADAAVNISLADLIVLAGAVAIEQAADAAGVSINVPFAPGRGDATQEQTDITSFNELEPSADAFRNYYNKAESLRSPTDMLVDKADQLNLTVPEMTVLLGGMRALGANTRDSKHGLFTDTPGTLSNDFFVTLLNEDIRWHYYTTEDNIYEGINHKNGCRLYTASSVDLVFKFHSELRAIAEIYASDDANERFVTDFVSAWTKVMQADRFDIAAK